MRVHEVNEAVIGLIAFLSFLNLLKAGWDNAMGDKNLVERRRFEIETTTGWARGASPWLPGDRELKIWELARLANVLFALPASCVSAALPVIWLHTDQVGGEDPVVVDVVYIVLWSGLVGAAGSWAVATILLWLPHKDWEELQPERREFQLPPTPLDTMCYITYKAWADLVNVSFMLLIALLTSFSFDVYGMMGMDKSPPDTLGIAAVTLISHFLTWGTSFFMLMFGRRLVPHLHECLKSAHAKKATTTGRSSA